MKLILPIITAVSLTFSSGLHAESQSVEADNTARNERDRSGETKTPFDQSEDKEDVELTASIRKMVVEDESISGLGKNVKIISADGNVVLRGPVENAAEKAKIVEHAKMAGAKNVTDQLETK